MDSLLFVLNPIAGGGRAKDLEPLIEESMNKHKINYDIIFTTKPKEAVKIVEDSIHNTIIAVGGDGTVNEVAKGLINRKYGTLGIIPGGTGNDLSRSLGISSDPIEAIKLIVEGNTKFIDIGNANGYQFLNIASFGFDAEVVKSASKFKKIVKGQMAYVLGVLFTLIKFRKKEVILEINGNEYKEKLVLLAVGNGKYYGGGMKILPKSKLDDGYLHLCLVKDASNLLLLVLFPTIFKGTHLKYKKYVEIFKTKEVKIKLREPIIFNIDGEIISGEKEIVFNLDGYKLPVIC